MIGRWGTDSEASPLARAASPTVRGSEHRIAALTLATVLLLAGILGTVNLLVSGVVREDAAVWLYASVIGGCMAATVPLVVRRRVGRWHTFGLVLIGDLLYVAVALGVEDPARYASPLMLLLPAFVAAWFLGPWELAVNMVITTTACVVALAPSYESAAGLVIQAGLSAGTLNAAALGVFILRRRVQRLLVATQALSILDPLTGLFNRRYLVEQAPRVWRQARRDGTRVAAMVLDLDHFKRLNDAHGHAAGDAVLRAVSCALISTVRPADVLARTGGEELVVVGLVSDPDEARRLAERLRAAVAGARTEDGHMVTASIGIALTRPVDGENAADAVWKLIDRADAAMYEAKQQGRDRVAAPRLPRARVPRPEENPARPESSASDVA